MCVCVGGGGIEIKSDDKDIYNITQIHISDISCSSELSVHQRNLKKNLLICFQHNNNNSFLEQQISILL